MRKYVRHRGELHGRHVPKEMIPMQGVEMLNLCWQNQLQRGQGARATQGYLILRHAGIHSIRPGQNSAGQIMDFLEPGLAQEVHRFRAAHA